MGAAAAPGTLEQPVFYYDLGSPGSYLAAERVSSALPVVPEWEPVLAAAVPGLEPEPARDHVARLAAELGLQPLRWPEHWPPDTEMAMRAATYAKQIGRAVAFSLAAFRQAFAGGRDLSDESTILIAGAACEIHPSALLKGIGLRSVSGQLERAGAQARAAGIGALPAIVMAGEVFAGVGAVDEAARALEALR